MAYVAPRTVFDYLLTQGVSAASAAGILANIQAESGFNSAVFGDGGTSGGLFQHHKGRLTNLQNYARSQGRPWTDWQIQVNFALQEAKGMNINLQATDAAAAAYQWTVVFERPANMEQKGRERAGTVSQYMFDGSGSGGAVTPVDSGTGSGAVSLPTDGQFVRVAGQLYMTVQAGPPDSGVKMFFKVQGDVPKGAKVTEIEKVSWTERMAAEGWVDGGSTEAFRGSKGGQSFMEMIEPMLYEAGIMGSAALDDRGVWRVIGQFLARPDMSPDEFQNRLRGTDWWKSNTEGQKRWNDLAPADQSQIVIDTMGKFGGLFFTYVGQEVDLADADIYAKNAMDGSASQTGARRLLAHWAFLVSSGQKTEQQFINEYLKPLARDTEGSPYWRILRDEEKQAGQHDVDIDTMAAEVVQMYHNWGVRMDFKGAKRVAEQIVMNKRSFAEVEEEVKDMAVGLYPKKPREVQTRTFAQPYLATFSQLYETAEPDLFNNQVQQALSGGVTLQDFRKRIKKSGRWMETKNAKEEFSGVAGDLGRMMGF